MKAVDCLNCGTPLTGRHCAHCGQPAATARLGGRDLVQPVLKLLDTDRGWLHTAAELSRRPGPMIRSYFAGQRLAYTEPLKYTMIAVALALFALWLAPSPTSQSADPAMQTNARAIMDRYGNVLLLMTVPLMAGASRILFRRSGANLAEHVVMNAYVFAQQNLISLPFLALSAWWHAAYGPAMAGYYAVTLAYYAWVLRGVMARTWWSAALAAISITAVAYLLFWGLFYLAIVVTAKF